ncbi:MAG: bifunctional 5,10-methylenetetrahydrofolate dehydrogenase/5,10-methenyltetrahydrofolate cyclohydrolase [Patescibacteria group bacterium]
MAIIDGQQLAQGALARLKQEIDGKHLELQLAAIIIGDNPALKKFVQLKKKAAQSIGIEFSAYEIAGDATLETIKASMKWLSKDPNTQGILVELPVPEHFNAQEILNLIDPRKDVDVLTSEKEEGFYKNALTILPPAVQALNMVFEKYSINPLGKKAAVFGQGRLVGKPITHWLKSKGAQVFMIDEFTANPEKYSQQAGIIITGVGKPGLITADMVKQDAIVIDYGYSLKGGIVAGDVEFKKVAKKASLITPVPGGMGPLVIVAVLENLVRLNF